MKLARDCWDVRALLVPGASLTGAYRATGVLPEADPVDPASQDEDDICGEEGDPSPLPASPSPTEQAFTALAEGRKRLRHLVESGEILGEGDRDRLEQEKSAYHHPDRQTAQPDRAMNETTQAPIIVALHDQPVTIEPNNFRYKSLSAWCCNTFLGCMHACPICFAPETSANKQKQMLGSFGILDPVLDWGRYLLLRPLDKQKFLTSLRKADRTHPGLRKRDGNDAIMFCSTTDAYQVIHHPDPETQRRFQRMARSSRRWMLETIRDHSALNVRILTRSPLAREDFDIFQSFGDRLLLGTSLPTLDADDQPHLRAQGLGAAASPEVADRRA